MTPYFEEPHGPDYVRFFKALETEVPALRDEAGALPPLDDASLKAWSSLVERLEQAHARAAHLGSYLGCLGAADTGDEAIQTENARLSGLRSEFAKAFVVVRAALLRAPEEVFDRLVTLPDLADVAYFLRRTRQRAAWSMQPELEHLAAELDPTGLSAWGRLYDRVSGRLEFELAPPTAAPKRVPVSMTRTLLEDADPALRRAALLGSNAAWEGMADVVAACLNGISGTRLTLYARRSVPHFLEPALFDAAISRRTLDVLLEVVTERQEVARRYLRHKARLLGRKRLGFQDLMAPLPQGAQSRVSWDEARQRVLGAFEGFYPDLARFAAMAFEKRWIDWQPRSGKQPGGFCSSTPWIGESRVFITFHGATGDVSTLAHELGHAFHSWLMRDMRYWARRYPMTLAETASTFAEQVVIDATLSDPDADRGERAALLDTRMQDAAGFLLNIPMRFQFEKTVYEERARGELPVSRLRELMKEAQLRCYTDTLFEDELDPWFWASKLHFYITGLSFYNFPYTFGYLFSLGIFARARQEGPSFLPRYEELLRATGSASAEQVAERALGIDLTTPEFWNASIDLIQAEGRRFEEAASALSPEPT
jgi:oligoendopeptidase F